MARHIPWFNPREMDDATVLALGTGREALLAEILSNIRQRIEHPGLIQHWLLTGPRGAGKSYFLRLLQASFTEAVGEKARFVLLPEELPNIYAPHELLNEIRRMLNPQDLGYVPQWKVDDSAEAWQQALQNLLDSVAEPLLVVGIENFDCLLEQAFSDEVGNSRLRHLLSNQPRIQFVVTALQGGFDEQYDQRMFRQFEQRSLPRWTPADHRDYLARRARQQGGKASPEQLNRIDAYSRYTGGNPRAAAILAATILDMNDPVAGAQDLDAAIEKTSDYYRALIERIPANTRKLFDALIRGGEPASQTELAQRTGAKQSDISRAFLWLLDNGYVSEEREPGQKAKNYRVQDRLLVQFYRMRYLQPGQRSRLAIMADLLADTLSFNDKWLLAGRYVDGYEDDAQMLAELALRERHIDINYLPEERRSIRRLLAERELWAQHEALVSIGRIAGLAVFYEAVFKQYPDDAGFKTALEHARDLAKASHTADSAAACLQLVDAVEASLSLCPVERYWIYSAANSGQLNSFQAQGLTKLFADETAEFQKLEQDSSETTAVAEFRRFRKLAEIIPRTASLYDLSDKKLWRQESLHGLPYATAAHWLAQAASGWQALAENEYLAKTLELFFLTINESRTHEFEPQTLLNALQIIEPLAEQLSAAESSRILENQGVVYIDLERFDLAYQAHQQARNRRLNWQSDEQVSAELARRWATWNLEKMAWCLGEQGQRQQALSAHRQALSECLAQQVFDNAAWNLGQIARYCCLEIGVAAAWQELAEQLSQTAGHETKAIKQLGDAVADACAQSGEAQAFAVGLDILQGLAERPQYPAEPALRALWLDMLEMKVPFSLLRDLLDEWPRLWPEAGNVAQLREIWLAWLDDLQRPAAEREAHRKTLDPDLSTTLSELEQSLPPKCRYRLGLLGRPGSA